MKLLVFYGKQSHVNITDNAFVFDILGFVWYLFFVFKAIIKKRPSRNINVQNFWLYVFGMVFNAIAIVVQDFDAVMNK